MTTATRPDRVDRRERRAWTMKLGQVGARLAPYRPMLTDVAVMFVFSRLLFYVTTALAVGALPEFSGDWYSTWHAPTHPLIDASWRWDSGWYKSIIQDGYGYTSQQGEKSVAFFPLYPALVRVLLAPLPDHLMYVAGVVVSHLAFLGALVVIWQYASAHGGRPVAQRTLYFLCIFPTSLFFSAAYSESVFLLVTALSLLALQRGHFALAGAAGFFAALTRPTGLYLVVPYVVEVWRKRWAPVPEMARRAAALLLIPAGLALFMFFLWRQFGDPMLFLSSQDAWHHVRRFPLASLLEAVSEIMFGKRDSIVYVMNVVNTLAGLLALGLGLALTRRSLPAAAYVLVGVLAPLTFPVEGSPTVSLARYVMVLFPMFIPLARRTSNPLAQLLITAVLLPTNIVLTALFVRWYWVI